MNEEQEKLVQQRVDKKAKGKEDVAKIERMKYEIAEEIGLLEKVLEGGWKNLSSREAGKIGGIMTAKKRKSDV